MIGEKLADRYEIYAELGRGGMGVVYRARDPLLNRDVAVKVIPPTLLSPDAEQRFQREAQLVAQMDHGAIAPIYDFGRHEGSLFFVMPVVEGISLRSFLRENLLLGDVIDIGIQVAEALEYSHARGVIHRDIKPENLMVFRGEGGRVRVRVMDFGLARAATDSRLTKSGAMVGTLSYLSPEQVAAREVDGRSDIYSLGTVLYECAGGEPPFSGEIQSVLYRIVHEVPQSLRSVGAAIDEELESIILGCLAKDLARRPQKAADLEAALRRYRAKLHESDRARSVTGLTRTFHASRPLLSPFVGRAKEFAELQQRLNAAVAGECQFVVVAGEPGIGKSRLLDELETLAKARKIRALHGRSVEQDRSFPYQGFGEVIQEHFRLKDTGSPQPPEFSDLVADLVSLFPALGEIEELRSGAGEKKAPRPGESPGLENRTHVFELLARTLTRIAGGRPLVLFLEDLHGTPMSAEALQYIVRRLGLAPILIVGTYRTTEVDSRHPLAHVLESFRGDRHFLSLSLGPFSPSEHRLFVETLVGGPQLSDPLVQKLYEGTEGNPFFTKELVRSLLDSGGIARDNSGAWTLSGEAGLSINALPATIQQAVEERIARLPDDLREILSVASVIGKTFDSRDLAKLVEARDVDEAVDRLLREGLIEEERESRGDLLTFASGVVRDVLYGGLSRRKRRSNHRKYAEHIEARHKGRLERILPQLLYHFSQADVPDKTVEYGLRLAKTSLDAFSAEEAARSAKTTLEFLDEEWEGERSLEGEARMLLARAHRMAGDIDLALKETETALRVFESQAIGSAVVDALLLAAETAWQARRTAETSGFVERGIEAARAAGKTESLRQLLSLASTLANLLGEYAKANAYSEEGVQLEAGTREAEAQEEMPKGGRLVVALANPIESIEPVAFATNEEAEVAANVFETLLATDSKGNLIPALCEKWEVSEGGKTFLLTLRPDVRFSDLGPLKARDLKTAFETAIGRCPREMPAAYAAIRGASEYRAGAVGDVAGLIVRGEDRLEIQVVEPLPIYPALLTEGSVGVARLVEEEGRMRFLGTGPFRLAAQETGRVVLERSPDYWRGAPPPLDTIEFRTSLSAAAIVKGFRSGEIDLARDLLPEDLEEILREPGLRRGLVEASKKNAYFILFNALSGPLARKAAVRRALSGVVRTRDLVWQTLGRFAQPATGLIPPGMIGHDPGRRARTLPPEAARAELRSAGVAGGVQLKASVHPLLLDRYGSLLTHLFSIWRELGVEVVTETSSMASYLQSWQQNTGLDLMIGRWNADYDDPDNFTHTLFHSAAGLLRAYSSSTESDLILDEARSEGRPAFREALYRRFEGLLLESDVLVPLFHDIDYRLASPKVRGLVLRGTAPYVNYSELGKVESVEAAAETRWGGGILEIPIVGLVHTLDPPASATLEHGEVVPSVFETLTREAGGARIVPWLAAEFHVEDSGRRYRFKLREDVRFHDGRRLTARDVRYSFERLFRIGDTRWLFAPIRGAKELIRDEADDLAGLQIHSATELSLELEEPISFFPAVLSFTAAAILPEGSDPTAQGADIVGTGPFRVVKFEPGQRLELERNRNYWRKGYPRSGGLVFNFGVPPKEILSGFRSGRFSLASDLFPADAEALRREPEFASGYRESPRLLTYYVAFNKHRGPMSDRRLRQALARAVDVPRLIRQTIGRLGIPAHGLIPPGLLGYEPGVVTRQEPLATTSPGSPPLVELSAVLNPLFFAGYSDLARELSATFAEKGVKIRTVNTTMAEWMEATSQGSVDVVVGRWGADYPDADTFVLLLHSQDGLLGRMCGSPEIDRLVERGRAETSPPVRHSLYRQVEEIIAREALLIPLFHEQAYRFARPDVEGLTVSLWGQTVAYDNLRLRG